MTNNALLRNPRLKAQPEKIMFLLRQVQCLGHVVSKDSIQ